jgi:hypothetical protein
MKRKIEKGKKEYQWKCNTAYPGITGCTMSEGQQKLVSGTSEGIVGVRKEGEDNRKVNEWMELTT